MNNGWWFILLCLSVLSFSGVSSVFGQSGSGSPSVKIPQNTHQFDTLKEGPAYKDTFLLINSGDAPLLINRVKTACRCLTPDWPQSAIKPGDTAKVKVTFFSDNRPGAFFKSIQVYTNISNAPLKMLYVDGYVKAEKDN